MATRRAKLRGRPRPSRLANRLSMRNRRPIKLTLSATLTTFNLSLMALTVSGLGYISSRNARLITDDLPDRIIDQPSRMIDAQVNDLLHTASEQGRLNLRMIQSGQHDVRDFPRLARYWLDVMDVHPRLTRLSIGLE